MVDLKNCNWNKVNWLELVSPGVFAVYDESSKEVFVSCSNNLVKGIGSFVTKLVEKDGVCSNMPHPEISVLYIGEYPRLRGSQIIDDLRQQGYKTLNKVPPISLSPKIRSLPYRDRLVAVATLRNVRGDEMIVGAFEQMADCQAWVDTHYPEKVVEIITKLSNELTQSVRLEYGQQD